MVTYSPGATRRVLQVRGGAVACILQSRPRLQFGRDGGGVAATAMQASVGESQAARKTSTPRLFIPG